MSENGIHPATLFAKRIILGLGEDDAEELDALLLQGVMMDDEDSDLFQATLSAWEDVKKGVPIPERDVLGLALFVVHAALAAQQGDDEDESPQFELPETDDPAMN